jgi:hypothetical protein
MCDFTNWLVADQDMRYLFVDLNEILGNLIPVLVYPYLGSRIVLKGSYCDGENANHTAHAYNALNTKNANAF